MKVVVKHSENFQSHRMTFVLPLLNKLGVLSGLASEPGPPEREEVEGTTNILSRSKPILTYFDLYGRGEAIRMALVHSKTDFEDSRVTGASWAAFKASGKCNNGQVPVLEVCGKAMNQSEAILRFVGSQTGAYVAVWFLQTPTLSL